MKQFYPPCTKTRHSHSYFFVEEYPKEWQVIQYPNMSNGNCLTQNLEWFVIPCQELAKSSFSNPLQHLFVMHGQYKAYSFRNDL